MIEDLDVAILKKISNEWKTVTEISNELCENKSRVNRCIIRLKKIKFVDFRFRDKKSYGVTPLEYRSVQ